MLMLPLNQLTITIIEVGRDGINLDNWCCWDLVLSIEFVDHLQTAQKDNFSVAWWQITVNSATA